MPNYNIEILQTRKNEVEWTVTTYPEGTLVKFGTESAHGHDDTLEAIKNRAMVAAELAAKRDSEKTTYIYTPGA